MADGEPTTNGPRQIAARELRATARLSSPIVAAQLAHMSMGFVDTVMVGRLGAAELAAVALGSTTFFFLLMVCSGVIAAVGPMVAQVHGAGESEPVSRSTRQGLWLAVMLGVPISVLLWNAGTLFRAIGQDPATVELATGYLRAICFGLTPALGFAALRAFIEGIARPLPITIITFGGVVLNIGANYVLMFGAWGIPAMGLTGTGWASAIVYTAMFIVIVLFAKLVPPFAGFKVFLRLRRPDPRYLKEIFRIGWPIGISTGIESGLFLVTTFMMGWISTTALAAHQIAIQCASVTFMVPLGIGIATSVRVGQAAGRADRRAVSRAGWTGIALGTLMMTGAALMFWLFPDSIVRLYLDPVHPGNRDVFELAVALLGIAAVFQLVDGIQICAAGALRGLKDTRVPMVIALFSYWVIGLSVGYTFGFVYNGGAEGLWWGLVMGLTGAAVLLCARFNRMTS